MADSFISLYSFLSVKPGTKPGPLPFRSRTFIPVTLRGRVVKFRERHGSETVLGKFFPESVQSGTDGKKRMPDQREELFADGGYGRLKSIDLVSVAAHKLLLFLVSNSLKERSEAF